MSTEPSRAALEVVFLALIFRKTILKNNYILTY